MELTDNLLTHHITISTPIMWTIFAFIVFIILFLDLFVFHKKSQKPSFQQALIACVGYMTVALLFGLFVIYERGLETGMFFYTGYLVEFSLSMDNIFVISLVFSSLAIPPQYQHRVLFWGVIGAIIMRAIMIILGESLVSNFHWILYVFSVFLIYTGVRMLIMQEKQENLTNTALFKFFENRIRVTRKLHGEKFFTKLRGHHYMTPLFFALIIIELMDVIFAIDSIPAIFLITQDLFVVYTSNIFAILGLRSLYFLLAAAINRFVYLKPALAIILIFIGAKIFFPYLGLTIAAWHSLIITFGLLGGGIVCSYFKNKKTVKN
ncbi:MAG: TerC/Alx family metal homeostasis membrane protein [Alphaproteobacteria bacterium]|nr:TerC/Alx family metal homeostasis membrane protein [Alphaproteobacteria bacterium]